ncbi:MAG TPA: phenylacetic acid degradation protein PaaY, partial [Geminicoccaceae bacterium]|nr:phenylacetic acid degradation protein PaaY [Geminicoccaceae bacterium]
GCRVGRNVLIGMNAVVMDGAEVGESSIVAAMAFIKAKTMIPPRSLVAGIPARVVRGLTSDEIAWKSQGTATYQDLAVRSLRSLRAVEPLQAPEPDRKRIDAMQFEPLHAARQKFGD